MDKKLLRRIVMLSKLTFYGLVIHAFLTGTLFATGVSSAQGVASVREAVISLKLKDSAIDEAFDQIERKTDYHFSFNKEDINSGVQLSREFKNATVAAILLELSAEANLKFKQVNDVIHVGKKEQAAQPEVEVYVKEVTVSGKVSSAKEGGLPGVSIVVKGTSIGTITDIDGNFRLTAPSEQSILVVSSVGYATQEVMVDGRTTINVELKEDVTALEEVVVVGYGTQKKKEVTSAVASVKEEEFNSGGVRSPLDLIQGKVAGLNITRTSGNNPNTSASIQLRGVNSLRGGIEPLIVIDGIPGANLDLLQQDDIESIDVLKDGSAAAIYGTRGNAGVILITTKKGKAGDPKYSYSTYLQREVVDRKPDFLTASEFRGLIAAGEIDAAQDFGSSTDLYDELIDKKNLSQYHNFSASGGSYKSNYRASIYFNEANGIAKENGRKQVGGRMNVNQTGFNERLDLQMNLAVNVNNSNLLGGGGGDFEQAIQRNPTAPLINPDGTFFETQGYNNYNPLSRLEHRISERKQMTLSGDARLTYEVIDGLHVSAFGSYLRDDWNDRYYRSTEDWDQRPDAQYQGFGYASKSNRLEWSKTFESTVDYKKVISSHSFGILGGYSYQYRTIESYNMNNNGFTTDAFLDWNFGSGTAINNDQLPRPGMGSSKGDNTLIAFFGRVNYAFKEKYFAQAILRREGSSRFGANNKWGMFPAASVGWTLSDEAFMSAVPLIDNLKARIGYGVTGNQEFANYQSLVTLGTGGVYPQDGVFFQTYGVGKNPNPDLKWEKKGEWNFGLDYAILGGRLGGSIDIYNRLTTDILNEYTAQQPAYVWDRIWYNVGSMRNKGVELLISGIPISKTDLQWNIDLTGSWQENKLEKLSNETFKAERLEYGGLPSPGALGNAIRLEEGGRVGNFYGKRFAGFTEDGQWLFYKQDGTTGTAGEMVPEDLTIIGNGVPKFNLALTNRVTYKNWDATVFFRGKFGYDILNTKEMYFGNKRWLPNNILKSAITTHSELDDNPQYSDYYLEDGGFVKLDNVTIGYNFDFNTDLVRNLRLYVTGRNILTFTKYSGIDPELQNTGFTTGIDGRGFYPRTKSFTVGLNFGF